MVWSYDRNKVCKPEFYLLYGLLLPMKLVPFLWLLVESESVAIASFCIVLSGVKVLFQYVDISFILLVVNWEHWDPGFFSDSVS